MATSARRPRPLAPRSGAALRLGALVLIALSGCAGLALPGALPQVGSPPPPQPPELVFEPPAELLIPEGLRAISGQYRAIPLQWELVLDPAVAGYLLESGPERDGPFAQRAILRDRGQLGWIDHGDPQRPLGDGVTRFYRLRTFDPEGRVSAGASEVVAATTAPLPDPPGGLRAYSGQPRAVPLAWEPARDAVVTGYVVERSPEPEGPFEVIAKLESRHRAHLLDTGLGDLRVLYYRVASRNRGGERGPYSEVLRAVTKPLPLPPIGLRVVEQRLGTNVLAWEPNVEPDLRGYRLLRLREDAEPRVVAEVDADHTRAEDPGVAAGETLRYAVVAIDRDGLASHASKVLDVGGEGYALRAEASAASVHLRWNPRSEEGFARAQVTRAAWPWQRSTRQAENGELVDRNVVPGRRYTYVVVLERPDGSTAPASRPLEVEVPEEGAAVVEIQEPPPRLPPPDVPR